MLNNEQSICLLMLMNRNYEQNNPIGYLPKDIVKIVINVGYDTNPDSEIGKALHYAAFARQEDVKALLTMLELNPLLLLQAGDVKTPGGDVIKRVKIYEFCLGAGDPGLAKLVQNFFVKIPHGEQERIRQYKPYIPHIENILKQKPYNLTKLITLIKDASNDDVYALLRNDSSRVRNNLLYDEIWKFKTY